MRHNGLLCNYCVYVLGGGDGGGSGGGGGGLGGGNRHCGGLLYHLGVGCHVGVFQGIDGAHYTVLTVVGRRLGRERRHPK